MSYSYTYNQTFTITHAKYLASKVAADLKRIQRLYGNPSDDWIEAYENEITVYLKDGYLEKVTYGFQRNGDWIEPTLIYKAQDFQGINGIDDDPGKIRPGADISEATFTSFLIKSMKWSNLTEEEKKQIEKSLPITRTVANEPGINGYLVNDLSYFSGGRSLNRSSVRKS